MKLFMKEWRLASLPLTKLFMLFGLMALIPGYPILMGTFFVCLGIFQSFQSMRENNDILYSVLLPVSKRDIVSGKLLFCLVIEGGSLLIMALVTLLRMTVLADAAVYRANAMMNANLCFLGLALLSFALFDLIFVRGFFRTAYYTGRPFIRFIIADLLLISAGEAAHHVPALAWMDAFGFEHLGAQAAFLAVCTLLSAAIIAVAWRSAQRDLERIDL